jgi:hypothetical protein
LNHSGRIYYFDVEEFFTENQTLSEEDDYVTFWIDIWFVTNLKAERSKLAMIYNAYESSNLNITDFIGKLFPAQSKLFSLKYFDPKKTWDLFGLHTETVLRVLENLKEDSVQLQDLINQSICFQ